MNSCKIETDEYFYYIRIYSNYPDGPREYEESGNLIKGECRDYNCDVTINPTEFNWSYFSVLGHKTKVTIPRYYFLANGLDKIDYTKLEKITIKLVDDKFVVNFIIDGNEILMENNHVYDLPYPKRVLPSSGDVEHYHREPKMLQGSDSEMKYNMFKDPSNAFNTYDEINNYIYIPKQVNEIRRCANVNIKEKFIQLGSLAIIPLAMIIIPINVLVLLIYLKYKKKLDMTLFFFMLPMVLISSYIIASYIQELVSKNSEKKT